MMKMPVCLVAGSGWAVGVANDHSIIIEQGEHGFSAYTPTLLGCVATGQTKEEVIKNMAEAIQFHLEGDER